MKQIRTTSAHSKPLTSQLQEDCKVVSRQFQGTCLESPSKGDTVVSPSDFQSEYDLSHSNTAQNNQNSSCTPTHAHTHTQNTYKKVERAIRLMQSLSKHHTWELAYSGGKDSDVLLWLAKQANIPYVAVHKCTTIDPPGTLAHCIQNNVEIIHPKLTFLQLVEKKGLPTMFRRFCCDYLKKYYHAPYVMTGVRAAESVKRAALYVEPTSCRVFSKTKRVEIATPMFNFTDDDIQTIINDNQIQCNPLYYDASGQFHVERRLGCLGCPLQGDRGRADFLQYPILLKQIVKRYLRYVQTHPMNRDPYDYLVYELFYSNHGETRYQQTFHGLFPAPDPKLFMEDYFHITLPDRP